MLLHEGKHEKFLFSSRESYFLKYKKFPEVQEKLSLALLFPEVWEVFSRWFLFFFFLTWAEKWRVHSWKYKKSFLLRKYNKTFPGRVFLGNNIRNFFRENFWVLGPKVQIFIFKNIRKVFYWENIGKAFPWEI